MVTNGRVAVGISFLSTAQQKLCELPVFGRYLEFPDEENVGEGRNSDQ